MRDRSMPQILVISSMVARGHVGLSSAVPVLNGFGVETISIPTILLSNHPGHARFAGMQVPAAHILAMLDALDANGWLSGIDAVLTGYFPTAEHVAAAGTVIARVEAARSGVLICCDPVIGDYPDGLYVSEAVATAVRDQLLPLSGLITPNLFELQWLTGRRVETVPQAASAASSTRIETVLVTSVPAGAGQVANVVVGKDGAWQTSSPLRNGVPHGTGDAMAAAFLAAMTRDGDASAALAAATGFLDALVGTSAGHDELQLVAARQNAFSAPRAHVARLAADSR